MDFTSKTYLASQAFAFLAMVVYMGSQLCKDRKHMLIGFVLGNLCNAVHMFLLGAMTGFAMCLIGAVRFGVGIFTVRKYWLVLFICINTVATWYVFEGWLLSSVSYLAATLMIISSFLQSDYWMRIAIIVGGIGWLLYGVLVGSIVAVISNAFFLISCGVGWYKHMHKAV